MPSARTVVDMQNQSIITESPLREARRSGSRLGRTTLLIAEAVANESLRGIDDPAEDCLARAARLSFVAQQLCAVHGVRVHVTGEVPRQPVARSRRRCRERRALDPIGAIPLPGV